MDLNKEWTMLECSNFTRILSRIWWEFTSIFVK